MEWPPEPTWLEPSRLELLAYDAGLDPQELRERLKTEVERRRAASVLA